MPDGANVRLAKNSGSLIDGRYRIERLVGRGSRSEVYRATDEKLQRPVAVKLFYRDTGVAADMDRVASEIRLLASLSHYALVTVFDARVETTAESRHTYLVMELVDGESLQERIDRGPISRNDVAAMVFDIAEALHVVHSNGVVHGDIKPANVLLTASPLPDREFSVKLGDFGIANLVGPSRLTSTGAVIGTAAYHSPEQAKGERPEPATDIYAFGLVLIEALTGVRAFPGSMDESVSAHVVGDPTIPDHVGHDWKELLTAMTAPDPEDRPVALDVARAARSLHDRSSPWIPSSSQTNQATVPMSEIGVATTPMMQGDLTAAGHAKLDTTNGPLSPSAEPDLTRGTDMTLSTAMTVPIEIAATSDRSVGDDRLKETPQLSDRDPSRSRRWPWMVSVLVGVLVLAAATVFLLSTLPSGEITPPVLPAVDGPLGAHLQELLDSVIP